MPKIVLKISSTNNTTYPKVMLRKFFNMVFISEDGKKLNIYTATVFGAIPSTNNADGMLISYNNTNEGTRCTLNFQYDGDIICKDKVIFYDKTQSLWEQADCVSKVWGACDKIDTQDSLEQTLKKVYPSINKADSIDMSDSSVYYIYESGKQSHSCIVTKGIYNELPKTDMGYKLSSDSNKECNGIEFMNWVKTEINMSVSILNKYVEFIIELDEGEYCTPDFTWYFAPPPGYSIDEESAKVRILGENKRNLVQSVADDTTVHFIEWVDDEEIDDRRKARVYLSPETSKDSWILSRSNKITVGVKIDNPRQIENKQFLLGLLLGFILSFCSDKTRINDYHTCVKAICSCGDKCTCGQVYNALGFIFPFLAVTTYLSIIFGVKKCVPSKKGKLRCIFTITKILSIIATTFVLLYVFFAWLVFPDMMQKVVVSCEVNLWIIGAASGTGIILNLIYIVYCTACRKKKIFDYL